MESQGKNLQREKQIMLTLIVSVLLEQGVSNENMGFWT